MKTKLLIIFLFAWTASLGQTTVPNTTTFTLGQVTKVIYGDSTVGRNTSTLFADSNAAYFDATYGSKTMSPQTINGFRNYKASDVSVSNQSATATGASSADISFDITSSNYALTDWAILCYTPNYTYVGRMDGTASGYSAFISQSYTGLSANSSYIFNCYGIDASGNGTTEWTNEITTSCTRPGGLYDFDLKYVVNGTTITSTEACDPSGLAACGTCLGYMGRVSTGGEGSDVYLSNGTSDCTKVPDGYYVSWQACGTDCWQWVGFQIIAGKWYYVYC
jgi:hypothetical protein